MNTSLVMNFDAGRQDFALLCLPTALRFAQQNGIELIVRATGRYPDPYTIRIDHVLQELEQGRRVIFADVDLLFRDGANAEDFFKAPINMSIDSNGLCDGVFAMQPMDAVIRFCKVWRQCGWPIQHDRREQDTVKILLNNFGCFRGMLYEIPETVVSNPESPGIGTHIHHFWSGSERALEKMATFNWETK